jgi:hypothetical protein
MIYRVERKENPFVQVDKGFITDKRLGFKEKGILLYFLSKPEGWNFYAEEIASNSSDGLSAVKAGIQKLMKNGYIVRGKRQRNESGQLGAYEYIVKEVSATCENPTQVFPTQENPTQENHTLVKNEDSNIYKSNIESKEKAPDKPVQRSPKFIQPSLEEVKAYCSERSKGVDPEQWYDHYQSNGWMVGKTHMKDWKAAVRTWERRNTGSSASASHTGNKKGWGGYLC